MKRALELDPNFAAAYAALGVEYGNLGQASLSAENIKKAYALRDRVSEHEKYRISALYYDGVTGELEQAIQVYELWAKSYPQDMVPRANLGAIYNELGQFEKALAETQEASRLEPNAVSTYGNLARIILHSTDRTTRKKQLIRPKGASSRAIICIGQSINWPFSKATQQRWSGKWLGLQGSPEVKTNCSRSNPIPRRTSDAW